MKNKFITLGLLIVPAILLASGDHEGSAQATKYFAMTGRETDFVPRVFNFLIFAGILYYLLANLIKDFFVGRQDGIANQLKDIESRLQLAKKQQKDAQNMVKESEKKAKEIVADAKKEALFLSDKVMQNNVQELSFLDKQLEEKMELESRKSARETINEVLNENITNDDIVIGENRVVSMISNKVVA
ncbi:MAG: F0F1 ATP synthase subunit B [Campylobacterales bacterium]|nr:F0F1 ATP synthase subunit B [Campylobacterales bacterium]